MKTIGILGGMGPQASCELYRLINARIAAQPEARNDSFPHLILNSLPVPDLIADRAAQDRTVAMAHEGALSLARAGASDIVMACNTMHLYQEQITQGLPARFHSLIDMVADKMAEAKRVLLLGSRTTIETGLYQRALEARGIAYCEPSADLCGRTVSVILATIAQRLTQEHLDGFVAAVRQEAARDPRVDAIGLVCTELPLVFPKEGKGLRVISSLDVAADFIVALHEESASATAAGG